uniref:Uncharacterized protein n=1 Tax=Oryza brachyantha TaxID=4533 RepID=J3L6E7_ORYBR
MFMYPEANVPVCQLSLQTLAATARTTTSSAGRWRRFATTASVLILGSGPERHAQPQLHGAAPVPQWASEFDETGCRRPSALLGGRHDDVKLYGEKAPHGRMARAPVAGPLLPAPRRARRRRGGGQGGADPTRRSPTRRSPTRRTASPRPPRRRQEQIPPIKTRRSSPHANVWIYHCLHDRHSTPEQ